MYILLSYKTGPIILKELTNGSKRLAIVLTVFLSRFSGARKILWNLWHLPPKVVNKDNTLLASGTLYLVIPLLRWHFIMCNWQVSQSN